MFYLQAIIVYRLLDLHHAFGVCTYISFYFYTMLYICVCTVGLCGDRSLAFDWVRPKG